MDIKASVRDLVEMIYGSGDLISERNLLKRAEQGMIIHQEHQSKYKGNDFSEVCVNFDEKFQEHNVYISGRIDGVIKRSNKIFIEEIKSTTKDLEDIDETTMPAHLAQAKIYAYLYSKQHNKKKISVRLTYIHVETRKIKKFDSQYTYDELQSFFNDSLEQYINWLLIIDEHETERNKSIEGISFPFASYREGQRELMGACYRNVLNKNILYAIAPTGVGKTIATIFSTLKAVNQKTQKIFFLTAKNLGKQIALKTIEMLIEGGLILKAIEITAKDHICFLDTRDCDSNKCMYSRGYYKKVFNAITDIYNTQSIFTKEIIIEYAYKHEICPFEFSLDASYYVDVIVCDYNYVFCPITHLIRYFEESNYQPILLIDEAHNLVSRSKDMYSASVSRINILYLNKLLKENNINIKETKVLINHYSGLKDLLEKQSYQVIDYESDFISYIQRLVNHLDKYINDKKDLIKKTEILKIYFDLYRFLKICEFYDDDYISSIELIEDDIIFSVKCLDASKFLLDTLINKTYASIFFSATLYPITYYKKMLTNNQGLAVRIDSPFNKHHLNIITLDSISTRYNDRISSVRKIIEVIHVLGSCRVGNYIVFFPSYQYMLMIYQELQKQDFDFEYIVQKRDFTQTEREEVINLFKSNYNTQIGLFVMGGMFAEGIDYLGDMLSGVIIVGTGLPMYGGYNNVVKSHFDNHFGNGFDFAYTYPGFAKVVQAVGRVIRTKNDRGVAILIDDRFTNYKYKQLYPQEWSHIKTISNIDELEMDLKKFWLEYK